MEAESSYEEAVKLEPHSAANRFNHGNILLDLGIQEEAVKEYKIALKIEPKDQQAYNNLGLALEDLGPSRHTNL